MNQTQPDQHTLDFARRVIAEVAPAEEPLFEPLAQAYLDDPGAFTGDQKATDDVLGFGGLEALPMMTPFIIAQVGGLFSFAYATLGNVTPGAGNLVSESINHAEVMVGGSLIFWFLKRLVSMATTGAERVAPMTAEQIAELRTFLLERLDAPRTEARADEVVEAVLHVVGINTAHAA